jgi:predicted acylesterase/phospholipase RssA
MPSPLERLRAAKSIGFLFCGGSARCAFQVGVAEILYELGIRPAACLGVSGGSWNAAAVAVGNTARLRTYWRFFNRMPYIDLRNLFNREHSPWIWSRIHARAFDRYIGAERIKSAIPLFVALTRIRDGEQEIHDLRASEDPLRVLLASNYLPPYYTHPPSIGGRRYADGGFVNNIPYEALLERGCDVVVMMSSKSESEGGLQRRYGAPVHATPPEVIVIRPQDRLGIGFIERRWERLAPVADLGALRAREVLGAA